MRTERDVFEQILAFARESDLIRAVVLNGSRVNPNVKPDLFCDYDVACLVTDPEPFRADQRWISRFGELIIMQQNDFAESGDTGYIFLMQFADGVRIDLAFDPPSYLPLLLEDSLTVVLLDKDHRLPALPPPSEAAYLPPKPDQTTFDKVVNEFWWCSTNVAKGIWRGELCYVKGMYEMVVREALLTMLTWYVGARHNWQANPGKFGKWLQRLLPVELWDLLTATYANADEDAMWDALFAAGRLARIVGQDVAEALGYAYPLRDDEGVTAYWRRVRALPKDATDFGSSVS